MALADGFKQWLDSIPQVLPEELTSEQFENLRALVAAGSPLETLLGLLSTERQGLMWQLVHLPITNGTEAARASAIQGQIKGLERARETLLELAQRADAATAHVPEAGGNN